MATNRPLLPLHGKFQSSNPNLLSLKNQLRPSRSLHWPHYPQLRIIVKGLPSTVTTLDIYNNFKDYGQICHILILERQTDGRGSRAIIEFEPPPATKFWPANLQFYAENETALVNVDLSFNQKRSNRVESPSHTHYVERLAIPARSVEFGILLNPLQMKSFQRRCDPQHDSQIILDLKRRQIEVLFTSWMESEKSSAARLFRFQLPLDEEFKIWQLPGHSYILHLSNIPRYSKQLKEAINQTHAKDSKWWSLEDTWARQSDIVDHKNDIQRIGESAISIRKTYNNINISRWTTFKIDLVDTLEVTELEKTFCDALRDFNVRLFDGGNFSILPGSLSDEENVWALLDSYLVDSASSLRWQDFVPEKLSFSVRYMLAVCLSHGWLSEYSLSSDFLRKLSEVEPVRANQILQHLDSLQERQWDPMRLFSDLQYRRPMKVRQPPKDHMEIRSATVTATSLFFHTPAIEMTNRIIRKYKKYAERFLRVRFEDDVFRGQAKLYPTNNNKMIQIFQRVRRVLRHGIKLGDVHYEFLAWGNSQLREHGAYFFARSGSISADFIRTEMGVFDSEKVVAKRAARMGQCFSTTRAIQLEIPPATIDGAIADIKKNSRNFTDGVGKISRLASEIIQKQLNIPGSVPSAYQFRLGGCKGVLVVWPELSGIDLQVRESQFKFNSTSKELEIIRWSEFWQPFLNRQIILCLSDLGIPDSVFLHMQEETIAALDAAMVDDKAALKALRETVDPNRMTLSMCELIEAGFQSAEEPFVLSMLKLWRSWILKYLKEKAKIPVRQGAFVLGCADETQTLEGYYHPDKDLKNKTHCSPAPQHAHHLPQIFIQITNPQTGTREVIEGVCILARNPSLHRGDIRVVEAVNVPALHHLCDVVVMPTKGDRDLPSMCSGGDLDGDDYVVIWDSKLIPKVQDAEPFHYDPPTPKAAIAEIKTDDIINFFYDYLQNDCLGRIAHAHLASADFLDEGIQSWQCLALTQLHSVAVDYPKTGVPALMEAALDRTTWPHFMEKKATTYRSRNVLGQLYDAVERVAFEPVYTSSTRNILGTFNHPSEQLCLAVQELKYEYDSALQRIMTQHDINTEFEVFTTFVLHHSKSSADYKFHEEIGRLSAGLKEQYRHRLHAIAGGITHEQLAPVALTAYYYTRGQAQMALDEIETATRVPGPAGMPFISFPWLLHDTLCWIARTSMNADPESMSNAIENSLDDVSRALQGTGRNNCTDVGISDTYQYDHYSISNNGHKEKNLDEWSPSKGLIVSNKDTPLPSQIDHYNADFAHDVENSNMGNGIDNNLLSSQSTIPKQKQNATFVGKDPVHIHGAMVDPLTSCDERIQAMELDD